MEVTNCLIKKGAMLFAPLEGITTETYRLSIFDLCPDWDGFYTDFLRLPTAGYYPTKHFIKHFGSQAYLNDELKNKTAFQILTPFNGRIEHSVKVIGDLGFKWIDLNLGCPANTVNKRGGGASLLKDLNQLSEVIKNIRKNYSYFFTCKIRIGYHDATNFLALIKMLESEGIDGLIVHARTRDQKYLSAAQWDYISLAVENLKIPVIGNGDLWNAGDINRMFDQTNCHAVMVARGALKTPWLAGQIKNSILDSDEYRFKMIKNYFQILQNKLEANLVVEHNILKFFKNLSAYLFDELPSGQLIKSAILRSQKLSTFWLSLDSK